KDYCGAKSRALRSRIYSHLRLPFGIVPCRLCRTSCLPRAPGRAHPALLNLALNLRVRQLDAKVNRELDDFVNFFAAFRIREGHILAFSISVGSLLLQERAGCCVDGFQALGSSLRSFGVSRIVRLHRTRDTLTRRGCLFPAHSLAP